MHILSSRVGESGRVEEQRIESGLGVGTEIELRGVSKRFAARKRETLALSNIDLGIRKQEFVTLLG
jgi:hypothetical protein